MASLVFFKKATSSRKQASISLSFMALSLSRPLRKCEQTTGRLTRLLTLYPFSPLDLVWYYILKTLWLQRFISTTVILRRRSRMVALELGGSGAEPTSHLATFSMKTLSIFTRQSSKRATNMTSPTTHVLRNG